VPLRAAVEERPDHLKTTLSADEASIELSSNRTAMSFERTMMSTDRTLMSAVRTAISLIGFGFTIFQFFHSLNDKFLDQRIPIGAPARFGGVLIGLGIVLLVTALWYNRFESQALRERRHRLFELGLIRHAEIHKQSSTVLIAILMLIVGGLAMLGVVFRIGLF
jgi:putative membrane protein